MQDPPIKKGEISQDEDGNKILINDSGKAIAADEIVIAIWNSFDGTLSIEKMAKDISEESGGNKNEIKKVIKDIVNKLEKFNLMNWED